MVNFAQMASVKVSDIPEAKPLPKGAYIFTIYKAYSVAPTQKGTGEMVVFPVKVVRPADDFENPDDLEAYGSVVGEARQVRFFFPTEVTPTMEDGENTLKKRQERVQREITKFLINDCGVEASDDDELIEIMARAVNHQFTGMVIWEKQEGSNEYRDSIGSTAPLE